MVICTTGGSKTIWIDGKGQPTGRDHICPDCMLVFVYLGADGGQLIEPFGLPVCRARLQIFQILKLCNISEKQRSGLNP